MLDPAAREERAHVRGRIASLARYRSSSDPDLVEERQHLLALKIRESAKEYAAVAPPMTPDQIDKLSVLLRDVLACAR